MAGPYQSLFAIGIDVGGSVIKAAVVDSAGTVRDELRDATPTTAAETEDCLADLVTTLRSRQPIRAVGLAIAGFISRDKTRVMFAPHLAWRDTPVAQRLAARTGLPVVMDHDVNAAAVAEHLFGSSAGAPVSLFVALGTGVGAGLVHDGRLYRGAFGVAPELGHLTVVPGGRRCACGKRGCWERYCSGTALAATARNHLASGRDADTLRALADGDLTAITGDMVAQAALAGDAAATAAFTDLGLWLGRGLAAACDVLDPAVIVLGGGVSRSAGLFLGTAADTFHEQLTGGEDRPHPVIAVTQFADDASAIGAAQLAMRPGLG